MATGNWRKSTLSTAAGNNCVQARMSDGIPQIGDSKLGDSTPILEGFAALRNSILSNHITKG